jgi:hypothetical protein
VHAARMDQARGGAWTDVAGWGIDGSRLSTFPTALPSR